LQTRRGLAHAAELVAFLGEQVLDVQRAPVGRAELRLR